jgi:hypothetical protein
MHIHRTQFALDHAYVIVQPAVPSHWSLLGMAGDDKSGLTAQLRVREALRRRFPRRPWMDVVTKVNIYVGICVNVWGSYTI